MRSFIGPAWFRGLVLAIGFNFSGGLSFAFGGGGLRFAFCNQQLAQHVDVSAQNRQAEIAFKSDFTVIATAFQTVARLQRPDRRFDPRMPLPLLTPPRHSPIVPQTDRDAAAAGKVVR